MSIFASVWQFILDGFGLIFVLSGISAKHADIVFASMMIIFIYSMYVAFLKFSINKALSNLLKIRSVIVLSITFVILAAIFQNCFEFRGFDLHYLNQNSVILSLLKDYNQMGALGIVLSVISFFSFACLFSGGTYSEEAQDAFFTWHTNVYMPEQLGMYDLSDNSLTE